MPKSSRFPEIKVYSKHLSYASLDKSSDFDLALSKGRGKVQHDFGSRQDRWAYFPNSDKHGKVGPLSYRSQDAFDKSVTFTKVGGKYSFGVGRESMKKLFVEEIGEVGRKN